MQPMHSNLGLQQKVEPVRSNCATPWKNSALKGNIAKSQEKIVHTVESKKKRSRSIRKAPKVVIAQSDITGNDQFDKSNPTEEFSKALRRVQIERWKGDRDLLCKVKDLQKQIKNMQDSFSNLVEGQRLTLPAELYGKNELNDSMPTQQFGDAISELKAEIEFLKRENTEFRERIWKLESKLSELVNRTSNRNPSSFPGRANSAIRYRQIDCFYSTDPGDSLDSSTRSEQNLARVESLESIKSEYFAKMAIVINKTEELLTEYLFPGETLMSLTKIIATVDDFLAGKHPVSNCEQFREKVEQLDLVSSYKRFELRRLEFTPKDEDLRFCPVISKDKLSWTYLFELAEAFGTTKEISSLRSLVFRLLPIPDDLFDKGRWHLYFEVSNPHGKDDDENCYYYKGAEPYKKLHTEALALTCSNENVTIEELIDSKSRENDSSFKTSVLKSNFFKLPGARNKEKSQTPNKKTEKHWRI